MLSPFTYISSDRPQVAPSEQSKFGKMANLSDHQWVEWQANEFMADLLLPRSGLIARIGLEQRKLGLRVGPIYIDRQGCTQVEAGQIISGIAVDTMIQYPIVLERIHGFKLINDHRFDDYDARDPVEMILSNILRQSGEPQKGSRKLQYA